MDPSALATIITLFTPLLTEMIKGFVPAPWMSGFKRLLPVIPPVVGGLLGYAGSRFGFHITPAVNDAVVGLFLGAAGSSGYDTFKAQLKK